MKPIIRLLELLKSMHFHKNKVAPIVDPTNPEPNPH